MASEAGEVDEGLVETVRAFIVAREVLRMADESHVEKAAIRFAIARDAVLRKQEELTSRKEN